MYERHREENSDVQISKGKIAEEKRYFRTAFFQESSEFLANLNEKKRTLVNDVFKILVLIAVIISFVSLGLFWSFIRKKAYKLTRQVADLYETIEKVLDID